MGLERGEGWGGSTPSTHRGWCPVGMEVGAPIWGDTEGVLTRPHAGGAVSGGCAGRGSEGRVNPVPTQVLAPQWGCRWGGGGGRCVWGPGEGMIHCWVVMTLLPACLRLPTNTGTGGSACPGAPTSPPAP